MTLQSQTPRATTPRVFDGSSRRDPAHRRFALLGLIALGVVLLVVVWARMNGTDATSPAAEDLAGAAGATTAPAGPRPGTPVAGVLPTSAPGLVGAQPSPASPAPAPLSMTSPGAMSTPEPSPTAQPAPTPTAAPTWALPGTPGAAPGVTTAPEPAPAVSSGGVMSEADRLVAAGRLVEARSLLNRALYDTTMSAGDRAALRTRIAALNEQLFFSPRVYPGDPLTDSYTIRAGDRLVRLPSRESWPIEPGFLARVNGLSDPGRIQVGQRLKVVRQPLHAVVHKSAYRLDLWAGPPLPPGATSIPDPGPDGQAQGWTFIRSYPVGLGDGNSTPVGLFVVRPNSKLVNPEWVNPRTRQRFAADDPKNPIGERWIGLQGVDERSRPFQGYGLHGTIEPESIGRQMSMGCVRLLPEDVEVVYDLLMPGVSTVRILD
jgi:hypothetical protein